MQSISFFVLLLYNLSLASPRVTSPLLSFCSFCALVSLGNHLRDTLGIWSLLATYLSSVCFPCCMLTHNLQSTLFTVSTLLSLPIVSAITSGDHAWSAKYPPHSTDLDTYIP